MNTDGSRALVEELGLTMTIGSLFAGIGGFDLGCECAGLRSIWNVERDPACRKLLAAKFPHAAQYDDARTVSAANLAPVDLICGGFPCQDLSVAGKRSGLSGERSGLFYQLTRITYELKPAFLLWENVPGLVSSFSPITEPTAREVEAGEREVEEDSDLETVLRELDRIGYHGGFRHFDARYFGLAQRRRRVFGMFARADIGAGRCAEILSLAEGVRWHPAPRREAGEDAAGTLSARAKAGGGLGTAFDCCGGLQVAATLSANPPSRRAGGSCPTAGHFIVPGLNAGRDGYNDGSDQTYVPEIADCLQERDSKGADSDTKRGHLIPMAFAERTRDGVKTVEITPGGIAPALTNPGAGGRSDAVRVLAPIAFQPKASASQSMNPNEVAPALDVSKGGGMAVAFHENQRGELTVNDTAGSLKVGGGKPGQGYPAVAGNFGVRRLTPRECERLQGFPDDWTAGFSDSVRYRMLGNAVAVPVARWIAGRLAATE